MVAGAKRAGGPCKLYYSVPAMFRLPYRRSFEVVIIANALLIVPKPKQMLAGIRRALTQNSMPFGSTFAHSGMGF